nr:PREDICTED: uncharacterized protein LOC109037897 [Bemisia tabaci]
MCKAVLYSTTLLFATALGYLVDRSLEPKAHGRDVVETVVHRIQRARIFSDDKDFFRRVAYTESKFGEDPETYRDGYYGGIWQFDRLAATQKDDPHYAPDRINIIHQGIKREWGIDWKQVTDEDLLKPFYSGLAFAVYVELKSPSRAPIPDTVKGQDGYWKDWYNTNYKGKYGDFETRVQELLEEDMRTEGGKIDIMVAVDGSFRVGFDAFASVRDSVARLVSAFDLKEAHVGMVIYSSEVTRRIPLMNSFTMAKLQERILGMPYPRGAANPHTGIMRAVREFQSLPEARKRSGVPRLLLVFTSGQYDLGDDPAEAAKFAAESGIKTCAFGVGLSINKKEVHAIANNDPDFFFMTKFNEALKEQMGRVVRRMKSVPQTPMVGSEITETMKRAGEKRYYRVKVPENGLTIQLLNEKGAAHGFWAYTPASEQPSSALFDGVLAAGETFIPPPKTRAPSRDVTIVLESSEPDSFVRMKIVAGATTKAPAVN